MARTKEGTTRIEHGTGDDEWLTADQVVARYKLKSKDTLYLLRSRGRGPKGYRFGKELRFKVSDLRVWEEQLVDKAADSCHRQRG